jgi:hypothetical protein
MIDKTKILTKLRLIKENKGDVYQYLQDGIADFECFIDEISIFLNREQA